MSTQHLWLFTMRFPHGTGEPFLENELEVLAQHYPRITVVPLFAEGVQRRVPSNVEVRPLVKQPYAAAGAATMLRHWRTYQQAARSVRRTAPDRATLNAQWPALRSRLRQALHRALAVAPVLFKAHGPEETTLYSYWTSDWATVLGMVQAMDPRVRFVSRMHGFDLYAERAAGGWPAFQAFHLERVERVFVASQAGLDDLVRRYPEARDRFELAHLGTVDHGPGPWSPSDTLRLVSCSNLVPLKRVLLLAEALRHVQVPVRWTHFGDGPERSPLEAALSALPRHVQAELRGAVPNADLLGWYRSTPVDLFVHLSASEGGVPVSMQEAASFGVPLLATAAGGAPELVGPGTGELLPLDVDARTVAAAIDRMAHGVCRDAGFREGVRAAWSAGFRATVNHARFIGRMEGALHPR
ncbi:MAG: glycosyltransferase [Flavobacteriales bacterium]|nr:glycosyltransferase [Flavobacteriales bacterium]